MVNISSNSGKLNEKLNCENVIVLRIERLNEASLRYNSLKLCIIIRNQNYIFTDKIKYVIGR